MTVSEVPRVQNNSPRRGKSCDSCDGRQSGNGMVIMEGDGYKDASDVLILAE